MTVKGRNSVLRLPDHAAGILGACLLCSLGPRLSADEKPAQDTQPQLVKQIDEDIAALKRIREKALATAKVKLRVFKTGREVRDVVLDLIDAGVFERGGINKTRLEILFGELLTSRGHIAVAPNHEKLERCAVVMWTKLDFENTRSQLAEHLRRSGKELEFSPPKLASSPPCWLLLLDFLPNGDLADFSLTHDSPVLLPK